MVKYGGVPGWSKNYNCNVPKLPFIKYQTRQLYQDFKQDLNPTTIYDLDIYRD